jgi:hypothetical protein
MRRLAILLLPILGCEIQPEPDPIHLAVDSRCEFLGNQHCMLPFPSDRWLAPDSSRTTGYRLSYEEAAIPLNKDGDPFRVEPYARFDGFSNVTPILTTWGAAVDLGNLAVINEWDESLAASSPTVLLDLETGERIPHFAEIDARANEGAIPGQAEAPVLLYLRPAFRLQDGHRYGVAFRDISLVDGTTPEPTAAFLALRDATITDSAELEARRPGYEQLFTALDTAGVERASLQQAFWFVTASGDAVRGTLLAMRDDAMEQVPVGGGTCAVTEVVANPDTEIAFRIDGTFQSPLYLDDDRPPARVVRDPSGVPVFQGWVDIPFSVTVPHAVLAPGAEPGRLFGYGHGLMGQGSGDDGEINARFVRAMQDRFHRVAASTEWQGMCGQDLVTVGTALSSMGEFDAIPERMMQGMVNQIVMMRSLMGACRDLPELQHEGHSVIAPGAADFIGISQGSINGLTFLTLSPDVERAALLVGGINYATMIPRSSNWPDYERIMDSFYDQRIDRELLLTIVEGLWEQSEPAGWAAHAITDPVPGTPEGKKLLYQVGKEDAQVPNISSDAAARTVGLPVLSTSAVHPWGLSVAEPGAVSAMVYYDLGAPPQPPTNAPGMENHVHGDQRGLDAAQRQIDAFLRDGGTIQNFCDGDCGPDEPLY